MESSPNALQAFKKRYAELRTICNDLGRKGKASKSKTERGSIRAELKPLMKEAEDLKIKIRDLEDTKQSDEKPDETPGDDSAGTNPQNTDNTSANMVLEYPISDVEPKKPRKSPPANYSVLRFDAGGEVHCFGQLDRRKDFNTVTVLPIIKTTQVEAPSYQIKVIFPRDQVSNPAIRFNDPRSHTVLFKFKPGAYTVDDHLVTDKTEFEDFVKDAPEHVRGKAKECMDQRQLYRVTFFFEEKGIQQLFYPNLYSSEVPLIQAIFDSIKLIAGCKTISIFTWRYTDLPANLQYLYHEQMRYESPLGSYYHKEAKGLAAYVQWGKIIVPATEERFGERRTFDEGYPEYNLIVHNGVARDKLFEIDTIKTLRKNRIKMTVTQAGPDNKYYLVFLQFPNFGEAKKIIVNAKQGLITWDPPPTPKEKWELAEGERPVEDNPWGWIAYIRPDTGLQHGAHLVAMIQRPENPENPTKDRPMPAPSKLGDTLQSQMVYYKVGFEVATTKALLKAGDQLRFKNTKGQPEAEVKRAIICGKDQTIHYISDLLEGLSDKEIAEITETLTPSQRSFILEYCRKLLNGLGFLQGPAGSGKTTIMKALVKIAQKRGMKVVILTDSNFAADNVIQTIASPEHIAVRVHSLGLERRHFLKDTRKGVDYDSLKPADLEPDEEEDDVPDRFTVDSIQTAKDAVAEEKAGPPSEAKVEAANREAEIAEGWQDDEMTIVFNDSMLKESLATYKKAKSIMNPDDPRMQLVLSAIWTWMLRVLGLIDVVEYSGKVKARLQQLSKSKAWNDLRNLITKSKTQHLNKTEWTLYGGLIEQCCEGLCEEADVVVCTVATFAKEWSKDLVFPLVLIDEATVISEAQFLMVWRGSCTMISNGDQKQLGSVIGSTPKTNPFYEQMLKPPFVRFIENGWPYAMLLEVMRMTVGLEQLTSDVFYQGELKPGVTTPLSDETRTMSRDWKAEITKLYPALRKEPEGLLYPVFFNIKSECQDELAGGQSKVNFYNIAAAIEHILWVVKSGIAKPYEIGIATPYAGQVDAYSIVLDKVAKNMDDVKDIRIGTSEWWQGKQAPYMVVDLVRATNDHGVLGFAKDPRRLNVLHSRQRQALVIFGDMDCTKSLSTDPIELQKLAHENRHLLQIFKWVQNKGRVVKIATEDLSQEFVELQKIADRKILLQHRR